LDKSVETKEENVDPWSLYIYAMKAPMTRDRYQTRLAKFFDFIGLEIDLKNNVTIPYREIIKSLLSKEKGFDMTTANRLFGFIALLAIVNIDKRPKIVLRKNGDLIIQRIPFALFEDLSEVLSLMDYSSDGIRPYLSEWYDNVFLETFSAKKEPDSKVNSSRGETITENRVALTSEELAKATFEKQNKKYTTKQVVESFVNPLINLGYIEKTESSIDKRHNIYYPALAANNTSIKNKKLVEMDGSHNFFQTSMLIVKDYTLYPSKQYLTSKIRQVLEYSSEVNDFSFMQLRDHDDNETDVKDLVDTIKTEIGIFNSMIRIIRMMTMIVIMAALQDPPYRF
jgi:hypothetical protein